MELAIYPTNARGFHLAHINCQSARSKIYSLKHYVSESKFDIFTISESWFTPDLSRELLKIDNYDLVRLDKAWEMANRTTVKRGGGIAAYINSNINYSTNELAEFNVSSEFAEMLWLSIKNPKHRDYIIGIVYRPPKEI